MGVHFGERETTQAFFFSFSEVSWAVQGTEMKSSKVIIGYLLANTSYALLMDDFVG